MLELVSVLSWLAPCFYFVTDFQIVKELLMRFRTNSIKSFAKPYRIGGAKEDRTPDLLRARQALSQLSYGPSSAAEFPSPFTVLYFSLVILFS